MAVEQLTNIRMNLMKKFLKLINILGLKIKSIFLKKDKIQLVKCEDVSEEKIEYMNISGCYCEPTGFMYGPGGKIYYRLYQYKDTDGKLKIGQEWIDRNKME